MLTRASWCFLIIENGVLVVDMNCVAGLVHLKGISYVIYIGDQIFDQRGLLPLSFDN